MYCIFPEILCLIMAVKYQRILVQDVMSEPGKNPLLWLYKYKIKMITKYHNNFTKCL